MICPMKCAAALEQVSPEIDPPSGMVLVVAALDAGANGRYRVKPGPVARVHVVSSEEVAFS